MDYTDESVSLSDTLVRRPLLAVWLAFAILLAIYHTIYSAYFPIDHIRIGDDYSFFFPALLDGIYWHKVLAGILLIKHLLQAKLAARSSAMAVVASISPPVGIPIPLLYLHP